MNLRENLSRFIRNCFQDQTSHMGTTIRTMEDHMINAQISHSIETMEIDPEIDLSIIRMGNGENMELFLVLHRLKGETSQNVSIASQPVISLTLVPSPDLTNDRRLVSHLSNKNFHKRKTRRHLKWFVSPQPTIPLMSYQTSVR